MGYSTTWYHLDEKHVVLEEFSAQPCFSSIRHRINQSCKYILYDFSNMKASKRQAYEYFLYLKSIPEFKELMPRSCKRMADTMKYKVDVTKFNGTKIFTMLTLIRAVVEDIAIVKAVISFDRKHKYSLSNLCILKLCGSAYHTNSGHWITMPMSHTNLEKPFASRLYWDYDVPCIKTGLGSSIHATFNNLGDTFSPNNPIYKRDVDNIKGEKDFPKKQEVQKVKYDVQELQLGF